MLIILLVFLVIRILLFLFLFGRLLVLLSVFPFSPAFSTCQEIRIVLRQTYWTLLLVLYFLFPFFEGHLDLLNLLIFGHLLFVVKNLFVALFMVRSSAYTCAKNSAFWLMTSKTELLHFLKVLSIVISL